MSSPGTSIQAQRPRRARKPVDRFGGTKAHYNDSSSQESSDDEPEPRKRKRVKKPANDDSEFVERSKTAKATSDTGKPKRRGGGRRKKQKQDELGGDKEQVTEEIQDKFADDNHLFNDIADPSISCEDAAEKWIGLYQSKETSLVDLINFFIQSSGCSARVDENEVTEFAQIPEKVESIEDRFRSTATLAYPIAHKDPKFKKFRRRLGDFIAIMFVEAHNADILYEEHFLDCIVSWLVELSTSPLRSFRHTCTAISLEVLSALAGMAVDNAEDIGKATKARDSENKKKGKRNSARVDDLNKSLDTAQQRFDLVDKQFDNLFQKVYAHRWQDSDPTIRLECARELVYWMRTDIDKFLENNYLQYLGWILNDKDLSVKSEALKGLTSLFPKGSSSAALRLFVERLKKPIKQMALYGADTNVRVAAIGLLHSLDRTYGLEDETKDEIAKLIFSPDPKIRKKVSEFWKDLIEAEVSDKHLENAPTSKKDSGPSQEESAQRQRTIQMTFKCFAMFLIKYGAEKSLETEVNEEDEDMDPTYKEYEDLSIDLVAIMKGTNRGRIGLAVEAIWKHLTLLSQWPDLVSLLSWDHSSFDNTSDEPFDEYRRLSEAEEAILIEVLVSCLRRSKADAELAIKNSKDKDAAQEKLNDITRIMVTAFPKLLFKHQADRVKVRELLLIPPLMNYELYLDLRSETAYDSLWDDIVNHFLRWNDLILMQHALISMTALINSTVFDFINQSKFDNFQQTLANKFLLALGENDIETAAFDSDGIANIEWNLSRIALVYGTVNLTKLLTESKENRATLLHKITLIANRAKLNYKEESRMIENALTILYLHCVWQVRSIRDNTHPESTDSIDFLNSIYSRLKDLCTGETPTPEGGIRSLAFVKMLDLVMLITAMAYAKSTESGTVVDPWFVCDEDVQVRCAALVQAEMDKYLTDLNERQEMNGYFSEDENAKATKNGRREKSDIVSAVSRPRNAAEAKATIEFNNLTATFIRAIHVKVINSIHGASLLANYGRFGETFDDGLRVIVDVLREEGIYDKNSNETASTIITSIKEAIQMLIDGQMKKDSNALGLGRILVNALVVRGTQLSILAKIDDDIMIKIHCDLITWAVTKIAEGDENANTPSKAFVAFKVLSFFIIGMGSQDAATIGSHLTKELDDNHLDSASIDGGDALRAYEKRLTKLSQKDQVGQGENDEIDEPSSALNEIPSTDDIHDDINAVQSERNLEEQSFAEYTDGVFESTPKSNNGTRRNKASEAEEWITNVYSPDSRELNSDPLTPVPV